MTRLYVLVEGQTEEAFVKRVITPHLQGLGVWAYAIIVATSRDASGRKRRGGGQWKHWRRDLKRLIREQSGDEVRFTTMFDLYGLPVDFPELEKHGCIPNTSRRAESLEASMSRDVDDPRLIPYLQRHEFEALVLAALGSVTKLLEDAGDLEAVERLRAELASMSPEEVNDGESTAPSKRLMRIPSYRKTVHGPLAVEDAGLPALRSACPRFGAWIARLEALGAGPRGER